MQNEMEILSEERASAVWQRAAELQAEAAQRGEDRLPRPATGVEALEGSGYRVADVRAAAAEAGIAPEFVTLALAESGSGDAGGLPSPASERTATRLLGTSQRSIEAIRRIPAEPAAVLEAMKRVLPAPPYSLALADTMGPAPLEGGVLIFDLPGYMMANVAPLAYHAAAVGLKQIRVMLRPIEGGTEVSITADLRRATRQNSAVALGFGGMAGAFGAAGGAALGLGVLALGALAALPAVAGAAILTPAATWGYGAAYRYYLRKFNADMEAILRAVDAYVRTGGGFTPPRGTHPPDDGMFGALTGSW